MGTSTPSLVPSVPTRLASKWYPQQESNLYLPFRKRMLCPLSYAGAQTVIVSLLGHVIKILVHDGPIFRDRWFTCVEHRGLYLRMPHMLLQ